MLEEAAWYALMWGHKVTDPDGNKVRLWDLGFKAWDIGL